jgi:cell fate regulator YaaT (PSP1 superfamily)
MICIVIYIGLNKKVHDELEALNLIRSKIVEKALPMKILEAEYQFDRHKLVFFFEAERRIDFRDLVSELFSLYKTRIWMQQVNNLISYC